MALDIAALGPVLIVPRLFISDIWMGKLMMTHLLCGSAPPGPDHDSDDDVASWSSIYSYHSSRYPHQERFMDEDDITVMGSLCRTPHAQYIPWIREWLQQDPDGIIMGASLSILNGGIFNHDDIPIEFRNILEGEYELTSSCGEDYLSVIMDQSPHGHPAS